MRLHQSFRQSKHNYKYYIILTIITSDLLCLMNYFLNMSASLADILFTTTLKVFFYTSYNVISLRQTTSESYTKLSQTTLYGLCRVMY